MNKMNKKGFTLVEIMIVVAIIGLLAAIGIPSFQKARTSSIIKSMDNNARIVDSAVEQWAMENGVETTYTLLAADVTEIEGYIKGGLAALTIGTEKVESTELVGKSVGTGISAATIYTVPTP